MGTRATAQGYKPMNGGKWITRERRLAIYIRDGFICQYCGRDMRNADPVEVSLDHLQARSHGGNNNSDNLVTACRSCNSARGNKDWADYATGGAVERIQAQRHAYVNVTLAKAIIAGTIDRDTIDLESAR